MSTDNLPNYIRSARKATGLSIQDLAHLIGHKTGSAVSHYESFKRTPQLETAIYLHIALGKPVDELFRGLHTNAVQQITDRADWLLTKEFRAGVSEARRTGRRQWLEQLAGNNQTKLPYD